MADKVEILTPEMASPQAILADVMNREGLDGVVVIARFDGGWETAWSTGVDVANLCMASMRLEHDVQEWMHEEEA